MKFLNDNSFSVWSVIKKERRYDFFRYLYIILQSACASLINSPEGQSYEEFMETALKNCGTNVSIDENIKKQLINNFKMYISKINQKSENYINNMQALWNSHAKISEKNRLGKAYFPAIPQYERALYEFELLTRKKNRKSDPKISRIESNLEQVANERLSNIASNLENENFNIERFQRRYSKYIQKHPARMTDQELCDYLNNYVIYKYNYVGTYAEEGLQVLGRYKVLADLNLDWPEHLGNKIGLARENFVTMGCLLSRLQENVLCNSDEETRAKAKREGTYLIINEVYKLLQDCEREGIYKRWNILIEDQEIFHQYRHYLSRLNRFTVKKAADGIRTNFLNKLSVNHAYVADFLEFTILTTYIFMWIEERNERVLDYSFPDQKVYESLGKSFSTVVDFLERCKKTAVDAEGKNEDKVCIKAEIGILEEELKRMHIDININDYTHTYYHEEKEKRGVQ